MLKNKAIVDEAEKLLGGFKPVTYDVSTQIKAIETFEAKAVRRAYSPHGCRSMQGCCVRVCVHVGAE